MIDIRRGLPAGRGVLPARTIASVSARSHSSAFAVNNSGQPIDTDGDGWPDYFEDLNGNGYFESGETDWQVYNSLNGLAAGTGLQVFTPLKP